MGTPKGAKATAAKALRLLVSPKDAEEFYTRGMAHFELGDYERAAADNSEAIRLKPDHVQAYNYRATAYEKIGDKAKAQADREHAANLERQAGKP